MKNKMIKLILSGAVSTGILLSSSTIYAAGVNNTSRQANTNKNIMLLAKQDRVQDGKYNVGIQTLKEKSEELSMAGQYIDSNAVLDVKGKDMYLTVKILRNDWMKNINILVNGSSIKYENKAKDKEGKVSTLRFKIPNKKSNIKFNMNVVPMGNAKVAFRVVLNDNIKKISDATIKNNSKGTKVINKNNSKKNKVNNKNNSKGTKVISKNSDKELPQTGSFISNNNLLIVGGVSTLLGAGLLKRRK